jgi:hypothetical protein
MNEIICLLSPVFSLIKFVQIAVFVMRMVMVPATGVPNNREGIGGGASSGGNMIRKQRQPATFEGENTPAQAIYRECRQCSVYRV